jgi:hypothetical protein
MRLRELQLAFWNAVTAGGPPPPLCGDAAARVAIYADMYRLRLRAALASTLPLTAQALDDFDAVADAYFAAHPSRSPSLRGCGDGFADFLGPGWHADLARLEWARHDVFDAVDEVILDEAALHARGADGIAELTVRLVAAHRLVDVEHAIEPAWRALADGARPDPVEPGARTLLVWREGVTVVHRRVDRDERDALAAAATGLPFGALCERLAEPRRAAELLLQWTRDQLLVG